MRILHVFTDTNLFLQCKALAELDWSVLGSYDRIDLLVTRTVGSEIDSLKSKGNDRRAARARSTSSLFRSLMEAREFRSKVLEQPHVELCLRQDLRPCQPEPTELNYDQRDDQLVGTMLAFCKADAQAVAVLLTHDTGPAISAQSVGLRSQFVPDDWLLPPEPTDSALKAEVERYRRQEPRFVISVSSEGTSGIQASLPAYQELTHAELLVLMSRLQARFPICADFGSSEPQERPIKQDFEGLIFSGAKDVYHPATREAIDDYKKAYTVWKEECSTRLKRVNWLLHATRDWPRMEMTIDNTGSRPADDALVALEIQGAPDVSLLPPQKSKEDDEDSVDDAGPIRGLSPSLLKLPLPPQPPRGKWSRVDVLTMMNQALKQFSGLDQRILDGPLISSATQFMPRKTDPNELYFKEGGRGKISRRIEYSCAQWRHAQGARNFEFLLVCKPAAGTHAGVVRVEVHAANLTQPQMATLPFTLTLTETSSFEGAKRLVEVLGA